MNKLFAPTSNEVTQMERDHMALSRKLAGECVVLLENDGALPLTQPGKIALYGAGVRRTVKGGTGSGDVNSRVIVNIEQGVKEAGFEITTGAWLDRQENMIEAAKEAHRKMIIDMAEASGVPQMMVEFGNPFKDPEPETVNSEDLTTDDTDTAVYVIARNSGEGADRFDTRGDYKLWESEKAAIKLLAESYRKFILVLNIGGVMDLSEVKEIEGVNAVVLMTQLGNIGGQAITDVLTGAVTPSGKLADTWAKSYADYPSSAGFSHNDGNIDDDNYAEGIYVGYRYFDTAKVEPLYPFGYGLSYTTFDLAPKSVEIKDKKVNVNVTVTNTGSSCSGKEVVEVYVSAPAGDLDKPYQELKGYVKTDDLAPGASADVTVSFDTASLASYCEACASWVIEAGAYIVRVGNSSRDTKPAAKILVNETITAATLTNICAPDNTYDELKIGTAADSEELTGVQELLLTEADVEITAPTYAAEEREEYTTDKTEVIRLSDIQNGNATVEELVAQLSVRELASFATGRHAVVGEDSVIGNASMSTPGAAGDTSAICLESRDLRPVSMADGPAGLRLQPHFKARQDGTILPGGNVFGDSVEPFPEYENPEDVVDHYQYCTAIPIGWALAQSWNTALIEQVGDMVGTEMEKFGVDIWLAPAMNIHRNPLCGRNFEYYSEDPVVTGETAKAITLGVQVHKGKGVSIKHYAANNQEDNRYQTNAHISERALREIYLKGFEICIRGSQPETIMTSYNLINGVHTANSYDLLQKVTRDEWGFKGLIMTDWYSTDPLDMLAQSKTQKYNWGTPAGAVHAGNDVQMPGSEKVENSIVDAVENGTVTDGFSCTKADLQFCAANIIRGILYAEG